MALNILVINWQDIRNPFGGGAEVHLHEIFSRIVERGHRVTLLCCGFPGGRSREEIDGIEVIRFGGRNSFNFWAPWLYHRTLQQQEFDVVFDDINKVPFFTPLFVRKPLMAISHHLFGRSIFRETWLPFALYVYGAERLIPRIYRRIPVMAVSPSTRDELTTLGIPLSHISVVYNGVNCQRYSPLPNQRAAHPVVGYLGRIKKYKSVNHLIRAFKLVLADVPEARLCITGTGDNLPALRELADRVGIADSVEFQGEVSEAKKIDSLRRAWLVVNPSQKEGWGITVLEANACGTPVVASDVPGLRDAVVDGHSGYLYPYGDIEALAERILTVIREIQQGREFAKAARAWARQFDWEVSAERTLDLIQHILAEA